jgi:23S rRNA pseudouridine1911/1915/1917 synthase
LTHFIRKDERHRKVHTTSEQTPGAQQAVLNYRVIAQIGELTWLEVRPLTGRKHQIRVQLAKTGRPIVGDRKYGSHRTFAAGIALHARRLGIEHPVQHVSMCFEAPVPASWDKFGFELSDRTRS